MDGSNQQGLNVSGGKDNSTLIWVLVGCAGLFVVGLCAVTGVFVWFFAQEEMARRSMVEGPYPDPGYPNQPSVNPNGDPLIPQPNTDPPRIITAVVSSVTGGAPVPQGATCAFAVERRPTADGYWCNTRILCGGIPLYGDGMQNGFFNCTLENGVVGADTQTTADDTDPAMEIDTNGGVMRLRDDANGPHGVFTLEARITDVH